MNEKSTYKTVDYNSADDLWEDLSPTRNLGIEIPHNLLFRGQGDASWTLIPSALRKEHIERNVFRQYNEHGLANGIVRDELFSLSQFVKHCDRTGIKIPNDSHVFRQENVGLTSTNNINYITNPSFWPNPKLLDLMALAQHHGVPTRLLDWTSLPYTACYFASSNAVSRFEEWVSESKLAIWVLDSSKIRVEDSINIYSSPGSISPNLAAQYGIFTVHPHNGAHGKPFKNIGLEHLPQIREQPVILKLTLPCYEAVRLLGLCCIAGFSAADIYPSTDGAGRAVMDDRNIQAAMFHHKTKGINIPFNKKN